MPGTVLNCCLFASATVISTLRNWECGEFLTQVGPFQRVILELKRHCLQCQEYRCGEALRTSFLGLCDVTVVSLYPRFRFPQFLKKSRTTLLCPLRMWILPLFSISMQYLLLSHSVATSVVRAPVKVLQCLCSTNLYFTYNSPKAARVAMLAISICQLEAVKYFHYVKRWKLLI